MFLPKGGSGRRGALLGVALCVAAGCADAACLRVGVSGAVLSGEVQARDYPAPEGAGKGRTQRVLLLVLATPVCVLGAEEEVLVDALPELQMAFDWASAAGSNLYLEVASAVGTKITALGTPIAAIQEAHRTPVLFLVEALPTIPEDGDVSSRRRHENAVRFVATQRSE